MDSGVGSEIYSEDLDIFLFIRLPNSASMFQAEVLGIEEASGVLLNIYRNI